MSKSGVVNLYKEKGFTSQDAIHVLRGILKAEKIGHTGTLDPAAEGVLPVCVGKATRAAELITGTDKAYRAEVAFGAETDTQDATGKVLRTFDYEFDEQTVREVCGSMIGTYDQIPPMYSAIKRNGQKLYDLARQGIEVERKPRSVTIHELTITEIGQEGFTMEVKCSKGTYIRALCEDIGRKLGYGAYMKSLVRTASGPYRIEDSYTLKEIEAMVQKGEEDRCMTDLGAMFADLKSVRVLPEDDVYLESGNFLTYPVSMIDGEEGEIVRMEFSNGSIGALYRISEHLVRKGVPSTRLRAFKMFI